MGEGKERAFATGFTVAGTGTCGRSICHNGEQKEGMSTHPQRNCTHSSCPVSLAARRFFRLSLKW